MNANRSTGQVLVERLQKYSHLLGAAEKLGIGKEFHHRVWEILEVAEILYRERCGFRKFWPHQFRKFWPTRAGR